MALQRMGHSVEVVGDGNEVLPALSKSTEEPFDLVLMDNQMPQMSGIEATDHIRKTPGPFQDIPIIALTADALTQQRQEFLSVGMEGFVAKPIEEKKLAQEIHRVMSMRTLHTTKVS